MANPRKFSEKIALHTTRQAEETAAFDKIMKEVLAVTSKVSPERRGSSACASDRPAAQAAGGHTLRAHHLQHQQPASQQQQRLGACRAGSLPDVSRRREAAAAAAAAAASGGGGSVRSSPPRRPPQLVGLLKDDPGGHPKGAPTGPGGGGGGGGQYRPGARARSPVGPIRRPHDRRLDTSPYSGPYLSPPADTAWRRTNSDSALHQSAMQGGPLDRSDPSNRGSWGMLPTMNGPDRGLDGRSRSSRDLPRVPGIYIHPSAPIPNQIPIGNNTGSLPDLTNMDFTSPIHVPLDQDQDSSPYSSSPINTSPSTLSPTSIPQGSRPQGRFHFTTVSQSSNHLSVPVNSRYPQRQMRQNVDNKNIIQDGTAEYTQLGSMPGLYQQQQVPPTPPSPTLQQGAGYRSPHRPSPQSSPGLGGRHSAPCSPGGGGGPSSPLSPDYQLFGQHTTAAQFHQHFEQLSMLDPPVSSAPIPFADPTPAGAQPVVAQSLPDATTLAGLELDVARYAYNQSQQQQQQPPPYPAQQSPGLQPGPNTPPSVPEIILTDFSADDITQQDFEQQLENEFFRTTEELREGLGPLDFDDFQILNTQPLGSVVPESVEECFRLEHS